MASKFYEIKFFVICFCTFKLPLKNEALSLIMLNYSTVNLEQGLIREISLLANFIEWQYINSFENYFGFFRVEII